VLRHWESGESRRRPPRSVLASDSARCPAPGIALRARPAVVAIPVQPLITGFSANVEPPTQRAHVGVVLIGKHGKFQFERHLGLRVPGHGPLRFVGGKTATGNVLPMSPNTC
jgi:hypothetical protein